MRYLSILGIFVVINIFFLANSFAANNCVLITDINVDSTNKYIDKKVSEITKKRLGAVH